MSFIRTFFGDIAPEKLGYTYSHEHIVCVPQYWKEKNVDDLLLDDWLKSKKDVEDFASLGGKTIVDATAVDYGRRVLEVAEISRQTGVQIIGTAGFNKSFLWDAAISDELKHFTGNYQTYSEWIETTTNAKLVDFVVREVEEGLEGTSYRAGQVKFGTGYNMITPLEEKTIQVIAQAHLETKAPIHSHTEAGTMALEQIELLRKAGINIENLSIGHMDRNLDPYMHEEVARTGAFLSFDGIGKIKYAPENARIDAILQLVEKGYEDQILVSGDTARKTYYKHYGHGLGLAYIAEKWAPRFAFEADKRKLDGEKLLKKIFVENPKRCFSFKK